MKSDYAYASRGISFNDKRGQFNLSFGMIFSIILIVIFVSFAFYAINKFLDVQNSAQVGRFVTEFQSDIDRIWQGSQGNEIKTYSIPKKIEKVCFIDYSIGEIGDNVEIYGNLMQAYYENENLFFYPLGSAQGLNAREMKNINLEETTIEENPLCSDNNNGEIIFKIKKDFGDALVTIGV